jgi:hypothetical protein
MFTTDSRTENFLTQLGVKWHYKNGIRLPADFTKDWNKQNIGRPVAIREEAVFEYSALMEAGSAAPAPVVSVSPDGLVVLDGVQRLSAAELRDTTRVSAYIVETENADTIATIRVLANARLQGRPEPPEWTRQRAVEVLVVNRGMSPTEVASLGGWKKADIERLADAICLQGRITYAGGPVLPQTVLAALAPKLASNDYIEKAGEPIMGFLQTIKQAKLSAIDAAVHIGTFFANLPKGSSPYRTYKQRLEAIQTDPEIVARVTGRRCGELPRDAVLLRTLRSADTTIDQILRSGHRVPNIDEFFRLLAKIEDKLRSIAPNKTKESSRVPSDMWNKSLEKK